MVPPGPVVYSWRTDAYDPNDAARGTRSRLWRPGLRRAVRGEPNGTNGSHLTDALASSAALREILERTEAGSWEWDIATNAVRWSRNLGPIHGLPPGAQPAQYEEYVELVHPADRAKLRAAVDAAVREGTGYELELRTVPVEGEYRWIWAHAIVLRDAGGDPVRIVGLTRDITEWKRREEREQAFAHNAELARRDAERLREVAARLSAAATTRDIADVIIEQGIPALAARTGIFAVLEGGDTLRFVRTTGYGDVFPERLSLDEPWPITLAVRKRETVELRDVDERRAGFRVPDRVWEAGAPGTLVAVPLLAGSRAIGALGFTRESASPLSERERHLVDTLAQQAAQALERAELLETEQAARVRAELLERHAAHVAAASTVNEVGQATVDDLGAAVVAMAAVDLVVDGTLDILAASGLPEEALGAYRGRPLEGDSSAAAEAIATGEPVVLGTAAEIDERYPASIDARRALGTETVAAFPLRGVAGDVIGALTIASPERGWLGDERRQLLAGIAEQTGLALDRASLYERDRRARIQAEGLQRVAVAVSTAATVPDVAAAIAEEALTVLEIDGVSIFLAEPQGNTARALASCGSIERHVSEQPEVPLDAATVTAASIREQVTIYAETVARLERGWPASAEVARREGVGALACVPLRVGSHRGAITLVSRSPKRFLPPERTFLELLARLCEQGLLRAQLYESERDAHARSEVLHELSVALSRALAPGDVHIAFLDRALQVMDAGTAALLLVDPDGQRLTTVAIAGSGATRQRFGNTLPVDGGYLVSTAFRSGTGLAVSTREELARRFPATARTLGDSAQAAFALPLVVGGTVIGAFELVFEAPRIVTPEDERLLATMSDQSAQALERARLYESEHLVALRLQRALLPEAVVEHEKVMIAARYEAGSESLEVGGDWYDTFLFPGDRIGVAVGDVVGHGIEAAAAMGRLRSAFAAFATDRPGPARLLGLLDRFASGPGGVDFATACYALLDPATGELRYASAGHPPMLLVKPSGETAWLDEGRSPPLCGASDARRDEGSIVLEPGSLLLLYSDGLVERRQELISAGMARLETAAKALHEEPVDEICERLLDEVRSGSDRDDDAVLVGLQLLPLPGLRFHRRFPAEAVELQRARAAARSWLQGRLVDGTARHDLLLAVGEACANAIEHAYEGAAPGEVELELLRDGDTLLARVRDFGSWRPPVPDPARGRGVGLMKALSESVEVDTGPEGTTVTLRCRLGNG